jgi:hypothetical protein
LADNKRAFQGILVGAVTGAGFGLLGFILAHGHGSSSMGSVMFFLVPLAAGFAIAMVAPPAESMIASAGLSLLVALVILITTKAEGVLCVVLAFPLLIFGVCAGLLAGYAFRKFSGRFARGDTTFRSVILLLLPLVIFAGRRAEVGNGGRPRQEVVTSKIHLLAQPQDVWADLQSLDSIAARKQLLMYVGLPIPLRCVMQGSGAGAKRTCYFDQGYIEETVLEWSPPNHMVLSIDRTNMPGRQWLDFEGAEYEIHRQGAGTVLTRATTISSNLYPSWYWRRFELWGVASEHAYLLSDLARRFSSSASESQ